MRLVLEHQRTQRGRQRQRHEGRNDRRRRDGDRELLIERPGNARNEHRRHEHAGQHQADRDDRPRHFVHRLVRGLLGGQPLLFHQPLDIFHDHDRIVDDDADRQHESEQRQRVERIAERQQHRERAGERDRNRHDRNDRRAPALQEQDDDQHHQHQRLDQRMFDRADRFGDIFGRVVIDRIFHPRREILRQRFQLRLHRIRRRQRVRSGQLEHADADRALVVEIAVEIIVERTEFDPRDIAQIGQPPLRIALDDDRTEFVRGRQPPLGLHAQFKGGAGGTIRRLADGPGGNLDILGADGVHHLVHRHVARGGKAGVDPHPHIVIAPAERLRLPDARNARDAILHLQRHIVGDILDIEAVVGRGEEGDHQEVGRILVHRDADAPHIFGQARLGGRHPVLHQHLCLVDIGALFERDGDLRLAVPGRR